MKVEIDAADQLDRGESASAGTGIGGQLGALEMLLYPSSVDVYPLPVVADPFNDGVLTYQAAVPGWRPGRR